MDDLENVTEEMQSFPALLVNKSWVIHSVSQNKLSPIYSYLRDPRPNSYPRAGGLADLADSSRDLAELIKVDMDLKEMAPDLEAYEILHRKVCASCTITNIHSNFVRSTRIILLSSGSHSMTITRQNCTRLS